MFISKKEKTRMETTAIAGVATGGVGVATSIASIIMSTVRCNKNKKRVDEIEEHVAKMELDMITTKKAAKQMQDTLLNHGFLTTK